MNIDTCIYIYDIDCVYIHIMNIIRERESGGVQNASASTKNTETSKEILWGIVFSIQDRLWENINLKDPSKYIISYSFSTRLKKLINS